MTSLFDLTGRVAIVTGSSRGIGRAIAERLAEHGASVVISSRKAEACAETAAAINGALKRDAAKPIAANISSKEELQHLIDETTGAFGRIDILVCNAASNPYLWSDGRHIGRPVSQDSRQQRARQSLADPHGRARHDRTQGRLGDHRLVGRRAERFEVLGAYNISKAADLQLARNLAVEWGRHNVRVNCIAPGLWTDFARALWENPETLKAVTATPLGRIGEADEIAGAAVYLASKAGSFTTGGHCRRRRRDDRRLKQNKAPHRRRNLKQKPSDGPISASRSRSRGERVSGVRNASRRARRGGADRLRSREQRHPSRLRDARTAARGARTAHRL